MVEKARLQAVAVLAEVLPAGGAGASLREALGRVRPGLSAQERGLMSDLAYGVCRHRRLLDYWLDQQLSKPIKPAAWSVRLALLCGIYELWFSKRPAHAVVNSWPDVCRALKAPWAAGLSNAILRKATRLEPDSWMQSLPPAVRWSLPDWLWQRFESAWPGQAEALAEHLCDTAPLTIRLRPGSAVDAERRLQEAGLSLQACRHACFGRQLLPAQNVTELPGFAEGCFVVQDEAAQMPATLIEVAAGARLLDACAAPGGKTGQLADLFPDTRLVALDVDAARLERVAENNRRLGVEAELVRGDAAAPEGWWDGEPFDAVLLDAPCSATGILRRQPDIKWHRRPSDIQALCGLQARMLDAIWPLIKPGGMLVYATCSILPEENAGQIESFLTRHADAREDTPREAASVTEGRGCQLLPEPGGHDGFFYARLRKC